MECGSAALARLAAPREDPEVLHGPSAQHPAEMRLAARGPPATAGIETRPRCVQGPGEPAEELKLVRVAPAGACRVQGVRRNRRPSRSGA